MIRLRFVTHHYRHENDMTWWNNAARNPMDYAQRMLRSLAHIWLTDSSRICDRPVAHVPRSSSARLVCQRAILSMKNPEHGKNVLA